jgi:deoxyribodipyrimidine photo-lyase
VYHGSKEKYGLKNDFIRQLIWRDFYASLLYAFPETQNKSYTFRNVKWSHSVNNFEKWCKGETGFPVVDACMRQLNSTGYMHNRGRMIVANFLVKTLLLDWRLGAKYFATKLTDYDVASNSLNWQNIASTGVYSTPYFRDMNPHIQSHKFDKDCEYIKKWVTELKDLEPSIIHNWYKIYDDKKYGDIKYAKPMADYSKQKEKMIEMYTEQL